MKQILTLNKISPEGLDIFDKNKYVCRDDIEKPDAIMVRSASMHEMELPAGQMERRGIHVLYYKDSAAIEDFLSACGATGAAMDLMLKKVERELRNDVNRRVNCETANLTKTVGAAARQIAAIERLEAAGLLEKLPAPLQITAQLRINNPEMSLNELCAAYPGTISKPGLNNRLRRLVQLGEEAAK